jgi:hypothetical protein
MNRLLNSSEVRLHYSKLYEVGKYTFIHLIENSPKDKGFLTYECNNMCSFTDKFNNIKYTSNLDESKSDIENFIDNRINIVLDELKQTKPSKNFIIKKKYLYNNNIQICVTDDVTRIGSPTEFTITDIILINKKTLSKKYLNKQESCDFIKKYHDSVKNTKVNITFKMSCQIFEESDNLNVSLKAYKTTIEVDESVFKSVDKRK